VVSRVGDGGDVAVTEGQSTYAVLRARILSGDLPANATLREAALAEELGVSRTPIREALRRLDAAGLVEFVPNRGATVIGWTADDLRETYLLRATLESRAAGLAAVSIRVAELERLAVLIDEMDEFVEATDDVGFARLNELNAEFHHIVVAASHNLQLVALTASVTRVPMMSSHFRRDGARFRAVSNHHHRDILTSLWSGDALWAEAAMRSHILAARNTVAPSPHDGT
jgi:DNA-binding GntR family transcriptional regulator